MIEELANKIVKEMNEFCIRTLNSKEFTIHSNKIRIALTRDADSYPSYFSLSLYSDLKIESEDTHFSFSIRGFEQNNTVDKLYSWIKNSLEIMIKVITTEEL